MRTRLLLAIAASCSVLAVSIPPASAVSDPGRQAEVSKRGAEVMPFELNATTHIFTKTVDGGVQSVVVKNPGDVHQIDLIRTHLREIDAQFAKGNYSAPSSIHGNHMPGLAELRTAKPGQVKLAYRDIEGGAEIRYATRTPELIDAIHRWFDAQLADHGADAMAGHDHAGMHMPMH